MKRKMGGGKTGGESGFTLIEFVMVMVIIGILAAVFIQKFLNLSTSARQAVITGSAGELASSGKLNSAECTANNNNISILISGIPACTRITVCGDASVLVALPKGGDNQTLKISPGTPTRSGIPLNGEVIGCTLNEATAASGTTAVNFSMITAGN